MPTTNATVLRKNLFNSLESVIEFNEQITVNTKKGNAIIISEEEYNSMKETIYLISQPDLLEKIKEGEKEEKSSMEEYKPDEEW